jgi:hypothetical protein
MPVLFAFISRHAPTPEQISMALEQGIELTHVGDCDAFTVNASWLYDKGPFKGAIVVHPAAALRLSHNFLIGVFENANRAPVGEKPDFYPKSLQVFDLRN